MLLDLALRNAVCLLEQLHVLRRLSQEEQGIYLGQLLLILGNELLAQLI